MLKLRRSLKASKSSNTAKDGVRQRCASSHGVKSLEAIEPPKKVIRALYDYTAQSEPEISFSKGDFFHVVALEDDTDWYEACNPLTNIRGLVPVPYFQVIGKNERASSTSSIQLEPLSSGTRSGFGNPIVTTIQTGDGSQVKDGSASGAVHKTSASKPKPLYGIVLYDFHAERQDELSASAGESILIIAQSNEEWFVAKPIGRLGGPGLIPVTFCQIRDMQTGKVMSDEEVQYMLRNTNTVPTVEQWKQQASEYKKSTISLGKFESNQKKAPIRTNKSLPPLKTTAGNGHSHTLSSTSQKEDAHGNPTDDLFIQSATIPTFFFLQGRYWFLVRVVLSDSTHLALRRFYEDFFDLQTNLLKQFPNEAGTSGGQRLIPYMPGPLSFIDDKVTSQRCADLNKYFEALLSLSSYISRCTLVRQFFTPREGDLDPESPTKPGLRSRTDPGISSINDRLASVSLRQTGSVNQGHYEDRQENMYIHEREPNYGRQMRDLESPDASYMQESANSKFSEGTSNVKTPMDQAFNKVKIYYRDDLIAIKISNDITYIDLVNNINERLSATVKTLRWKDEEVSAVKQIDSDTTLKTFLNSGQKLVLYAY